MVRHTFWILFLCTACLTINGIPVREDQAEDSGKPGGQDAGAIDAGTEDSGPPEHATDSGNSPVVDAEVGMPVRCIVAARDPLIGLWQGPAGFGTCEFFSNGRYREDCGFEIDIPGDWKLLDDGRYYLSIINSFGAVTNECLAVPTFAEGCDVVVMDVSCGGGSPASRVLQLVRVTPG